MQNNIGKEIKKDAIFMRGVLVVALIIMLIYGYVIDDFLRAAAVGFIGYVLFDKYYEKKQALGELVENAALINEKLEMLLRNQASLAEIPEHVEE